MGFETWASEETAEAYDRHARTFSMYRETSADLVRIAGLSAGERVVDLACGTGATTQAVLEAVGPSGRVFAVDGSAAMLAKAKKAVRAPNLSFHETRAESFDRAIVGAVDAVVCNSAFWQMDTTDTLRAARRAVRSGGIVAFNLGAQFFRFPDDPNGPPSRVVELRRRMFEIAQRDHGYKPPPGREGPPSPELLDKMRTERGIGLDLEGWRARLAERGWTLVRHETTEYRLKAEETYSWMRVPVFAAMMLPGLDYEAKMDVLTKAFFEVNPRGSVTPSRWIHMVAKPAAPSPSGRAARPGAARTSA